MKNSKIFTFLLLLLSIFGANELQVLASSHEAMTAALPLSASGRWIVDAEGRRVKLSCVNWVSHLDVVVAEGLAKQPVDVVSKKILSLGFNCVRFTWPLFLATNESLASLTVRQSFQSHGLLESIAGFQVHNPSMINLTLIDAFEAVVSNLGENNVMVILDNHISKPGWCCSNNDGNGFFGDQYFNSELWIKGLSKMATLFNGHRNVVGMSLRNELRGPRQNVHDWYRYMQRGAETVHRTNPNLLVILSGLSYDTDLSFLRQRPVDLAFTNKIVFEAHRYSFTDGQPWKKGSANHVCGTVVNAIMNTSGYLLDQGSPLFFGEFGVDQRGTNINDNRFLACFLGFAADLDLDFALWTLAGSYSLSRGLIGGSEFYGILDWDWAQPRNQSFLNQISLIQTPLNGPGLEQCDEHKIIFHPATGLCIHRPGMFQPLRLGPCSEAQAWNFNSQGILAVKGTYFCLQASGSDQFARLGLYCWGANSKWDTVSDSKMHLAARLGDGTAMCLDVNSNKDIITTDCKCQGNDIACDPSSQWFKIVSSTTIC